MIFATNNMRHVTQRMAIKQGTCTIKQFSDGELFVRIDEDVSNQQVWVLAATQPPANNLLELFFLLDALRRAGARSNLFISYFAYARQIIAAPGEAGSAEVICKIIQEFAPQRIYIMHPHTKLLHNFLPFTTVRDIDFFCKQAELYDAIAAPDQGATEFAREIARLCNKEVILLTKTRPEHEQVNITSIDGSITGKKVLLVDDIISTGRTLVAAAHALKKLGAHSIAAAATHGIFAPGAPELIEQSILEKVWVTNTVAQQSHGKITVVDISATIANIMREQNAL